VFNAKAISMFSIKEYENRNIDLKVYYSSYTDWKNIATLYKIMPDMKKGVQRTAYFGIVCVRYGGNRLFIVPTRESITYDKN
jgi:hypothetical protein